MFQPWIGRQTMERRPQNAILRCVRTELRENTMCCSVLERKVLQAPGKVYAAPDPPESLTMHHMGPPQLDATTTPGAPPQNREPVTPAVLAPLQRLSASPPATEPYPTHTAKD